MSAIPESLLAAPAVGTGVQVTPWTDAEFASFHGRTARALWAYVAGASGDRGLADDLVQEAYLRFLQARVELAEEEDRRRYLFRIASNLLHDHWRRNRRSPMAQTAPMASTARGDSIEDGRLTADTNSPDPNQRLDVQAALARLSPRERELVWLAHVEGLAHRELAERVGLRPGSVRVLLFRARRRLASWLEGNDA